MSGTIGIQALPFVWLVLALNAYMFMRVTTRRREAQVPDQPPGPPPVQMALSPELEKLLAATQTVATKHGHKHVTLEHFLLAMTADVEGLVILRGLGADPAELASELESYLELLTLGKPPEPDPWIEALRRAFIVAMSAGRTTVSPQLVLVQLVRTKGSYAALLLGAAGIEPLDVLRYVSHGKREPSATLDDAQYAAVRLHNDDYTTMDFVVHVLRTIFRLSEPDAHARMLQIHKEGSVELATLPADVALDRVTQVHEEAERAGFPLRCTLEPVT